MGTSRSTAAAVVAMVLGLGNAAVTVYWLAGGTWLLDTVGGEIEQWGRQRGAPVLVAMAAVAAVKLIVAASAPLYAGRGRRWAPAPLFDLAGTRWGRALGWTAATGLVLYGGLLTMVGLAVQVGLVHAAGDADHRALRWHAYLWDPWFLAWGLALGATLWTSSCHATQGSPDPAGSPAERWRLIAGEGSRRASEAGAARPANRRRRRSPARRGERCR